MNYRLFQSGIEQQTEKQERPEGKHIQSFAQALRVQCHGPIFFQPIARQVYPAPSC